MAEPTSHGKDRKLGERVSDERTVPESKGVVGAPYRHEPPFEIALLGISRLLTHDARQAQAARVLGFEVLC
jgi:hypothetical protein